METMSFRALLELNLVRSLAMPLRAWVTMTYVTLMEITHVGFSSERANRLVG